MLNTYAIATMGYNISPLNIAALGFLYTVEIIEVPEEPPIIDNNGGNLGLDDVNVVMPVGEFKKITKPEKKYKIKVTVSINDRLYSEEKVVTSVKKPRVEDVKIEVDNSIIPQIKINLTE